MLSDAPELDPSCLEPPVGLGLGSEAGVLPLAADAGTLEVVFVWTEAEADGLLGHVEPLDLESDPGKLNEVWSLPVSGSEFDSDGDGMPVEMDCPLDMGKLNDVLVPDPDGLAGTFVDTDWPLDMGKLKDVLSPVPGLVLVPDGPEGAPVGVVCPLDMGKLNDVPWSPEGVPVELAGGAEEMLPVPVGTLVELLPGKPDERDPEAVDVCFPVSG